MIRTFIFILFMISVNISLAQQVPFEYMGAIKLNDTAFISYKLVFNELDGVVEGYSISDVGGPYETKSTISGTYDDASKNFNFKELDIVYTKSSLDNFDMCLVHFSNKVRKLENTNHIKGKFNGRYIDEQPCLDGELFLTEIGFALERAEKIDKKLQKSKKLSDEAKMKVNLVAAVDTLSQSSIKKRENLNVFAEGNEVIFSIYDSGKVDGDEINLYIDDKLVLENFVITAQKQKLILKRQDTPIHIRIEALNEGTSSPNTVKIEALDNNNLTVTRTLLNTSEEAYLTFIFK